jgi:hypothetical protein
MKKTLLALLLATSFAFAEEVTVTGYGNDYNAALENAKVLALEKGASTYIIGEKRATQGRVTESIEQYNGGVIKSFKVISHRNDPLGYEVEIVADVTPKDNRVIRNNTDFSADFKEFSERERVVNKLDNVGSAISATVVNPKYNVGRYSTVASGRVVLTFQPKWVSDMREFTKVVNQKGLTSNNVHKTLHGQGVAALLQVSPIAAVGAFVLGQPSEAPMSNDMMVCFDGSDCYSVGVNFENMPRVPKLVLASVVNGNEYILYEQELDMKMYELIHAGEGRYHSTFSAYKTNYNQPTLIVYPNRQHVVDVSFVIDNTLAKQMDNIKVFLR